MGDSADTSPSTDDAIMAVTPLLGLSADWPENRYELDFAANLVRATPGNRQQISDAIQFNTDVFGLSPQVCPAVDGVEWLLVHELRAEAQHGLSWDIESPGPPIPLPDSLRGEFRRSFLTALRIVGPTDALVSITVQGEVELGPDYAVVDGISETPISMDDYDEPEELVKVGQIWQSPFSFGPEHLDLLRQVWPALNGLMKFHEWAETVCRRDLYVEMDTRARARQRKYLEHNPEGEDADTVYRQELGRQYARERKNMRGSESSRLLRMIEALDDSCGLPTEQSFLKRISGLETLLLLRDERTGVTEKLAARTVHVLSGPELPLEQREALEREIKEVYEVRSKIVHGSATIDEITAHETGGSAVRNGFRRTREVLQRMLCDDKLYRIFSTNERMDKKGRYIDAKPVADYFAHLRLGT